MRVTCRVDGRRQQDHAVATEEAVARDPHDRRTAANKASRTGTCKHDRHFGLHEKGVARFILSLQLIATEKGLKEE